MPRGGETILIVEDEAPVRTVVQLALERLGYTVLVAAEIVAASAGIGWMIWDASKFLLTPVVIMGLVVLGITGWVLDGLVRWMERRMTPWRFLH